MQVDFNKLFHVPDYQLGRTWEIHQCSDFFEGVAMLLENKQQFSAH